VQGFAGLRGSFLGRPGGGGLAEEAARAGRCSKASRSAPAAGGAGGRFAGVGEEEGRGGATGGGEEEGQRRWLFFLILESASRSPPVHPWNAVGKLTVRTGDRKIVMP
jgi:hypothetical protein